MFGGIPATILDISKVFLDVPKVFLDVPEVFLDVPEVFQAIPAGKELSAAGAAPTRSPRPTQIFICAAFGAIVFITPFPHGSQSTLIDSLTNC